MAMEFSQLISPNEFTTSLAILVFGFLALFGYMGYRLRNAIILFSWFLTIVVFILTILIELEFIWFWLMIMITAMVIAFIAVWNYILTPYFS